MSKVLKHYKQEDPLRLIDYEIPIVNNKDINFKNTTHEIKQKSFENEAAQLLDGALYKANTIIEDSKKEAMSIILKAQEDKEKIKKQAYDKGYENGYKKGLKEVKREHEEKWNKHMNEIKKTRCDIDKDNKTYKKYLEKECIKLSVKVAEKVLKRRLEDDENIFIDFVKKGIEKVGDEKNISIRVSDKDYQKVYPIIINYKDNKRKINVIKDPYLGHGDCIIDGPNFEIDTSICTQINNITETLKELGVIDNDEYTV